MKVKQCLYCRSEKLNPVAYRTDDMKILECQRCHLMMTEDLRYDMKTIYDKKYFEKGDKKKLGYESYFQSPVANVLGKYAFAKLFSGVNYNHLDLGSADGSLMEIFAQEGFDTVGIDISEEAVSIARQRNLRCFTSDLHTFPGDIGKRSLITAFDLFEHVDRLDIIMKNIHQHLTDDGVLVFSTLCVKENKSTDHWFSNSLEHSIYFTEENLKFILQDVFGKDSFSFFRADVEGASIIWGFASKKKQTSLNKVMIKTLSSSKWVADQDKAYLMSLFYGQISQFSVSEKIIKAHEKKWSSYKTVMAWFMRYYTDGKIEKALGVVMDSGGRLPISAGVFWQAHSYAVQQLSILHERDMRKESDTEILKLREKEFKLRQQLHDLTNSRIVGRIIRMRSILGDKIIPGVRKLPAHITKKFKVVLLYFVPKSGKRKLVILKRYTIKAAKRIIHPTRPTIQRSIEWIDNVPKKHLISVVIPYYNRADTIDETLQSLEKQTFTDFETIIVNDGSPDARSVEKFNNLQNEYTTLKLVLINQINQGVAVARNNGIAHAQGRYIICLDSDDILQNTYIEKCVIVLESNPDTSVVTSAREDFGAVNDIYYAANYDPIKLYNDNMVTTAAAFLKNAWKDVGGYKSNLGYEDWEFWLSMAEKGYWGVTLREPLFKYRVALQSRFMDDKDTHWTTLRTIKSMHPNYKTKIGALKRQKAERLRLVRPNQAFMNISRPEQYSDVNKPRILIAIPWMTFGGAETLIYNYCRELKNDYDITFVTGVPSEHEWEYKFREISNNIYHLPQLFESIDFYGDFISNFIFTHKISILHIVHSGYLFDMLPMVKENNPKLKVVVTMFNDRVEEYVRKATERRDYINQFNTDSNAVAQSFKTRFEGKVPVRVIPNGINCYKEFNPANFERNEIRGLLGLKKDDIAVFFVGRMSEEKNPDVFIRIASKIGKEISKPKIKFFMIGDGPMTPDLKKMINEAKVKNIQFLGYKQNVAEYLAVADVFILPSKVEGFPLSILEAMAMETAIIASRVGAVPDVIKDGVNGYIISPGSIEDGIKALRLLIDPETLNAIKTNNRRAVEEKYSNRQLGLNYRRIYKDVLHK